MKIKFSKSVAGLRLHFVGGEVYDLPPEDASYWVREGLAEFVEEEKVRPLVTQEINKPKIRPVKKR